MAARLVWIVGYRRAHLEDVALVFASYPDHHQDVGAEYGAQSGEDWVVGGGVGYPRLDDVQVQRVGRHEQPATEPRQVITQAMRPR